MFGFLDMTPDHLQVLRTHMLDTSNNLRETHSKVVNVLIQNVLFSFQLQCPIKQLTDQIHIKPFHREPKSHEILMSVSKKTPKNAVSVSQNNEYNPSFWHHSIVWRLFGDNKTSKSHETQARWLRKIGPHFTMSPGPHFITSPDPRPSPVRIL